MTTNERDWESLVNEWRAQREDVPTAILHRLIAAERRRTLAVIAGECAVIAGFAWFSWLAMRDGLVLWETVWLTTLWMFTAVAVPFAWWSRRGTWSALVENMAEFERRRDQRRRRTLGIACGLFVAEAIVVIAELAWFDRLTARPFLLLLCLAVVFTAWAFWMRRRLAQR